MCSSAIDILALTSAHPDEAAAMDHIVSSLAATYPEAIALDNGLLSVRPRFERTARLWLPKSTEAKTRRTSTHLPYDPISGTDAA